MKTLFKLCNSLLLGILIAVLFGGGIMEAAGATVAIEAASAVTPKGVLGTNTYADSVLQEARSFLKDENNKRFNLRPQLTKAMDLFLKDREFTLPKLDEIREAETQTTKATYMKKGSWTIGTEKACSLSGETSGSGSVTLSWNTRNFTVISRRKQFQGNELKRAEALGWDMYNAEHAFWRQIDTLLIAELEANKSGVNNGTIGDFDSTNDIYAYKQNQKDQFYNFLTADMQMNDYEPLYLELHNTAWEAQRRHILHQGPGNDTNTSYQYDGFKSLVSNQLSPGTIGSNTYESLHYIVPAGGVAILDWNDPTNRGGDKLGDKEWTTFKSLIRPEFTFDVYKTVTCADTTSVGGGKQDIVEQWEFSLNYATAVQPIETADETPIFKVGVMTGNTFTS